MEYVLVASLRRSEFMGLLSVTRCTAFNNGRTKSPPRPERIPALGRLARELCRETIPLMGADLPIRIADHAIPFHWVAAVEQPE